MSDSHKPFDLPPLVKGPVKVQHSGAPAGLIKSTRYTFAFHLDTASGNITVKNPRGKSQVARAADDLDGFLAALLTNITANIDNSNAGLKWNGIDPTVLRTQLFRLTKRDIKLGGGMLDGVSVVHGTGQDCTVQITIPESLKPAMEDGDQFAQGSVRFKKGFHRFVIASLTPQFTAANTGTFVVSNLAWSAEYVYDAMGPPGQVGAQVLLEDLGTLRSDGPELEPRAYLYLDSDTAPGADSYTWTLTAPPVETEQSSAAELAENYEDSWLDDMSQPDQPNPNSRSTPLYFIKKGVKYAELDFSAYAPGIRHDAAGATGMHLLATSIAEPPDSAIRQVHTDTVGADSTASSVIRTPSSALGQTDLPTRVKRFAARIIVPGEVNDPNAKIAKSARANGK